MAASSSCNLQEEVKCGLCLNVFVDPSVLSCGHSFCRSCLEDMRVQARPRLYRVDGKFPCPKCRHPVEIPSQPQVCYELHSIAQAIRRQNDDGDSVLTDVSLSSGDTPIRASLQCEPHSNRMTFFCNPCQRLLCGDCVLEDHGDHEYCKISEARSKLMETIRTWVERGDLKFSHLLQAEERAQLIREQSETRRVRLLRRVRRNAEDMIHSIRRRQRELEITIQERFLDCTATAEQASAGAHRISTNIGELTRAVTDENDSRMSDAQLVKGYTSWVKRVESFCKQADESLEKIQQLNKPNLCLKRDTEDDYQTLATKAVGQLVTGEEDISDDESTYPAEDVSHGTASNMSVDQRRDLLWMWELQQLRDAGGDDDELPAVSLNSEDFEGPQRIDANHLRSNLSLDERDRLEQLEFLREAASLRNFTSHNGIPELTPHHDIPGESESDSEREPVIEVQLPESDSAGEDSLEILNRMISRIAPTRLEASVARGAADGARVDEDRDVDESTPQPQPQVPDADRPELSREVMQNALLEAFNQIESHQRSLRLDPPANPSDRHSSDRQHASDRRHPADQPVIEIESDSDNEVEVEQATQE